IRWTAFVSGAIAAAGRTAFVRGLVAKARLAFVRRLVATKAAAVGARLAGIAAGLAGTVASTWRKTLATAFAVGIGRTRCFLGLQAFDFLRRNRLADE